MAVATFDTLKFANTLKAAGVPPAQAEAQAVAFAEVMQLNLKELVTKDDLAGAVKDLRHEIKEVEQRISGRIDTLVAQLQGDMRQLKWMFGALVGIGATFLVRMFLFRGPIG